MPAVLFAAAAYEVTMLLDLWGSYPVAYEGAARDGFVDAEETVAAVAYLTMLAASVVAFVHAFYPRVPPAVALFAPGAAAFMTTRFYSYDPYYQPSPQRYSESMGAAGGAWVLGLLAAAVVVGVWTRRQPGAGSIATACILPLLLLTSLFASTGH